MHDDIVPGGQLSARTSVLAAASLALALAGCGLGEDPRHARVEVDTVGDTVVVRNHAGSVWGETVTLLEEASIGVLEGAEEYIIGRIGGVAITPEGTVLLVDEQAKALREYEADGSYLRTIGRAGSGPGEYQRPAGVVVLPDGRIALRDFGNARINIYSAQGESLDHWPIPGGFSTSDPLRVDSAGRVYTAVITDRKEDGTFRTGLLRFAPDGTPLDTLRPPDLGVAAARLVARSGNGQSRSVSFRSVPFAPGEVWEIAPSGHFVTAATNRYSIQHRPASGLALRIERVRELVAVYPDEERAQREVVVWGMRRTDPKWSWSGPDIPDTKPPIRSLMVGQDGRLWVQVSQPGERFEPEVPERRPGEPERPVLDWREPTVYDVFEPDGRYLGEVRLPERTQLVFMRGDHIWAVSRDELDVQRLVRFRIAAGE